MKPSQLIQFLPEAFGARMPVLVTGQPGIGKSDIAEQAAAAAGCEYILSHPAVADPTDAKGLPWMIDGAATFVPFGEMRRAIGATAPTVWALDDFGQAPPAVQASYMQLLLARRVNEHILPDCVTFLAMTNRRTDRAGVTGILEPVKSRFGAIVELEPNLDDWTDWAFGHGIDAALIAFLRFRPDLLANFEPSADLTNSPLPRTWANLNRILGLDIPEIVRNEAMCGAVGQGAATEFLAFLRLYQTLPAIDGILVDPDASPIPTEPGTLYAVTTALGMRANVQNIGRIARYATRLMDSAHGEFAALLIRDAVRRDHAITQTPDFIRLAAGELGQLISGAN